MKPHFAVEARSRVAAYAMEQARAFVALIAPWLALPGDRRLSPTVLILMAVLMALGLATTGVATFEAIQIVVGRVQREHLP